MVKFRAEEDAFTLTEVLVATIIIALIATIAVVGLSNAESISKQRACRNDVSATIAAVSSYANDYPPSVDSVTIDFYGTSSGAVTQNGLYSSWAPSSPAGIKPLVSKYLAPLSSTQPYVLLLSISPGYVGDISLDSWAYKVYVQKRMTPQPLPAATDVPLTPDNTDIKTACKKAMS